MSYHDLNTSAPKMLQNYTVYKIIYPRCKSRYVCQTTRHFQQRLKEHVGNKGVIKSDFTNCEIIPTETDISILGKSRGEEYRLLTLEALFIKEFAPVFNTKDEYRRKPVILKF